MEKEAHITGAIIAGGRSKRLGTDKALIYFKGKKLIEYAIELMQAFTNEIVISANKNKYTEYSFPVVPDNYPDLGPISGLEAVLKHSRTRKNMVVPCDTPFLSTELYETLINFSETYDAVVPRTANGKTEPLIAVYSKDILPVISQQIKKHDYKLQHLLKAINTKFVLIDNKHNLSNINTISDLNNISDQSKKE